MDWRDPRPKPTSVAAAPGVRDGQSRRRVSVCQLTHDGKLPAKLYPGAPSRPARRPDDPSTVRFSLRAVA
jgi:hypothetical protein